MLSRLGHIWFSNAIARLARLSRPRGVEIRQQPYIVRAGDRYEVKHYKGEVLIALVSVLDIIPLAVIYAVIYTYNKSLKIKCLISWLKLSRYIQGTYSSSSIYILRGRVIIQSSRISTLFTVYIGLLVSDTSFIVS